MIAILHHQVLDDLLLVSIILLWVHTVAQVFLNHRRRHHHSLKAHCLNRKECPIQIMPALVLRLYFLLL